MVIKPIKPKRVADQVFEQLRELIYKGRFQPGERLAPERNLAMSMDVSRTSIRLAISKLVDLGMLEHIHGEGVFVSSQGGSAGPSLSDMLSSKEASISEVLEVRLGLECNAAELAAKRASVEDLESLKKTIDDMAIEMERDGSISTNSDTAFHMGVIFSSKNQVLIHLMRYFYDSLFVGIKTNLLHMNKKAVTHEDVVGHHREIYEMISKRDSEGAGMAMEKHLRYVKEYFSKYGDE
jgi:GntR family transcriptional regulator, transcriptional repressor for pyruvate dehydrogenase complex